MLSLRQVLTICLHFAILVRTKSSDVSSEAITSNVSTEAVSECLIRYIDSAANDTQLFNFGVHATLTRDNAVRADGLTQLSNLVMPLLIRNPNACFRETEFKNGVATVLAARPARVAPAKSHCRSCASSFGHRFCINLNLVPFLMCFVFC